MRFTYAGVCSKLLTAILFVAISGAFASESAPSVESHCGTMHAVQAHAKNKGKNIVARTYPGQCKVEDYYDSVYTRKTDHFEIFYTLKGVHATTKAFVDSVATDMEMAWDFHVNKMGMKNPIATTQTYHYQKPIEPGLYPIEIVDLNNVRNSDIVGTDGCTSGCFGITHPTDNSNPQKTQIFLDNDFYFVPTYNIKYGNISINGKNCTYPEPSAPLISYDRDYTKKWGLGIRVTAFHELYHAVQLRYMDFRVHWSFWFEASASGVEEITAPDIDDYISHISQIFYTPGFPLDQMEDSYAMGILYLYLYNHYDKHFDKKIWEGFSKNPNTDFKEQLSNLFKSKNLSADSIFHDFITRLAFSGSRSNAVDSSYWICKDQPQWPSARFFTNEATSPKIEPFSYYYYSGIDMDLSHYIGKASAIQYHHDKASIKPIVNTASLDTIQSQVNSYDSLVWVFSRFEASQPIPAEVRDSTFKAYPTPWRSGNLCFSPLPLDKDFIEIRTRRGDLVMREPYTTATHCIDEATVKSNMRPGLYRFRAGTKGKTKDILIIY